MGKKNQTRLEEQAKIIKRRPTIGLLIPNVFRANEELVWLGAMDTAREHGANLICFTGGYLNIPNSFGAQANILYQLIDREKIDGLVIFSSTVGWYTGEEGLVNLCKRYEPLPVISLDRKLAGIPSVVKSDYQGMREAIIHLIERHGYRRIAFLRGPEDAAWAQERFRAYTETLAEYGLGVDEKLIAPPPSALESVEHEIGPAPQQVNLLLDERKLEPGVDFEALVGATDNLIQEAMAALRERGIQIPEQVAVTGFDDEQASAVITPPLTTVQGLMRRMGSQGIELLLARLGGEETPTEVVLPSELVVRQSCGCQLQAIEQAAAGLEISGDSLVDLAARREALVAELSRMAGSSDWAGQLWNGFAAELLEGTSGAFLAGLAEVLRQAVAAEQDVTVWQNVLSRLRQLTLPMLVDREDLLRMENLWQQGQILIGEMAQRTQAYRKLLVKRQMEALSEVSQALSATFDTGGLMDVLAQNLPRLNIPGCYLSMYEDAQNPEAWSQLILAYNEGRRVEPGSSGQRFPSRYLTPGGLLPQDRQYSVVVEPLYFRENQLGFVLIEVGPRDGGMYDALRSQISSALQGALLVQRVQERSAELMRQQSILDAFMDNVPDYIYFKDSQSRTTRANRALATKMGVKDASELIGTSDFDFYPLDRAEIMYQQEQELIKTGQPIFGLEETDGMKHWMTTKMPLRDEKGTIIGTFGISSDITELIKAKQAVESRARELEQAYETLQKQQQALLIAEKMASLGRLTAGIAHEMNTPLAAVRAALANVERLVKEYQASIGDASVTDKDHYEIALELHSAAQLADKAAERAAGFVRGIKSQTRSPAAQEHKPINAVVAVEDALLLLSHALRQGKCKLDFEKSDDDIRLIGTPGRLEQVVTNLVNNAIDASYPQGGTIKVRLNKHSEFVELQVSDHGSGILPGNLSKIFDPMFSTKPFGSSTGLGLTIVHDIIVGDFNGSIDVTSEPGQGATFTIRLPL